MSQQNYGLYSEVAIDHGSLACLPKPIEKYSPGLSELWIWLPVTEHRISSLAITRVSPGFQQPHLGLLVSPAVVADVPHQGGGPSKGLTRRRGGFAIVNSWDGGWERGKQSALPGLAVAPERLSWHQSSISERPLMDAFLSHAVPVYIHAKQQTLWWKTRVWHWE